MPDQLVLTATSRTDLGARGARKVRHQGGIPAVLYGHGAPQPITLNQAEFRHHVTPSQYGSIVVSLRLDDQDAGTALIKAVQMNPIDRQVLNVDLLRVSAEDRIHVTVPVVLLGEPEAARAGGVLEQLVYSVNLRCRADQVPEQMAYDVTHLQIGESVHAAQLSLTGDCELLDKAEEVIALMAAPTISTLEEAVEVEPGVAGPDLTGEKQKSDSPPER